MAHQFTITETIQGVSIEQFAEIVKDTSLHEAVCRRIPGENLEILESNEDQRRSSEGEWRKSV